MKAIVLPIILFVPIFVFAQPYLVQNVNPSNIYSGVPSTSGCLYDDWYYYSGNDSITDHELWKSNGDTCILVADLFQGVNTNGWPHSSSPFEFTVYNGILYFAALDSVEGVELWGYAGINSPYLVSGIPFVTTTNLNDPIDYSMRVYNGDMYIFRTAINITEMFKFDGITATLIAMPLTGGSILNEFQGKLILVGTCNACSNSAMLWQFDGVNFSQIIDAVLLHDVPSGWGFSNSQYRKKTAVYQNSLYFPGYDSLSGYELWKYDGTLASLEIELIPGPNGGFGESSANPLGSFATRFVVYQNKLCFAATDSVHAIELWQYDGVSANMIQDVNQYNPNLQAFTPFPRYLELFDDKLYFMHSEYSDGLILDSIGLFVYDGNTIQAVADVYPNHLIGTNPHGMKTAGPYMYFYATDSIHGRELWRLESCNIQNSGSQTVTACQQYMSLSGEPIYESGVLTDTLTNSCGGDSIVTTYLTVNTLTASITQNAYELQANNTSATYQWIDCENGNAIIPGETNQTFEPNTNGNYAVIVTDINTGCVDTSACATISGLSVDGSNLPTFKVFPNPSTGEFFIEANGNLTNMSVTAFNVLGQVLNINTEQLKNGLKVTLPQMNAGITLLKIELPDGVFVEKVFVE